MIFLEKSSCVVDEALPDEIVSASAASVLCVFLGGWSCVLREALGEMLVFSSLLCLQLLRPAAAGRPVCRKLPFSLVKRSLFFEPC
jgi:hypothetical protein